MMRREHQRTLRAVSAVFIAFAVHLFIFTLPALAQTTQAEVTEIVLNPLTGSNFQIRWGVTDDASDLIPAPPRWRKSEGIVYPGCFLKGSTLRANYTIQNNTTKKLGVRIEVALEERQQSGAGGWMKIWSKTYGSPDLLLYPDVTYIDLPLSEATVDGVHPWEKIGGFLLTLQFRLFVREFIGWTEVNNQSFAFELFTVLGAPQAPMGTPWVTVLQHSCFWMRRTSDEAAALRQMTKRLFGVRPHPTDPNKACVHDDFAV